MVKNQLENKFLLTRLTVEKRIISDINAITLTMLLGPRGWDNKILGGDWRKMSFSPLGKDTNRGKQMMGPPNCQIHSLKVEVTRRLE